MNKYRNKKVEVDMYAFDSIAESRRYKELKNVYNVINTVMKKIEDIDMISLGKRKSSQIKINEVYKILDDFRNELMESIKSKGK